MVLAGVSAVAAVVPAAQEAGEDTVLRVKYRKVVVEDQLKLRAQPGVPQRAELVCVEIVARRQPL